MCIAKMNTYISKAIKNKNSNFLKPMKKSLKIFVIILLGIAYHQTYAQFPIALRGYAVTECVWSKNMNNYLILDTLPEFTKMILNEKSIYIKQGKLDWIEKKLEPHMTTADEEGIIRTFYSDTLGQDFTVAFNPKQQQYQVYEYSDFDVVTQKFRRYKAYLNLEIDKTVINEKESDIAKEHQNEFNYNYAITYTRKNASSVKSSEKNILLVKNGINSAMTLIKPTGNKIFFSPKSLETDIIYEGHDAKQAKIADNFGRYCNFVVFNDKQRGVAFDYGDYVLYLTNIKP
jgi:hypothetical protein